MPVESAAGEANGVGALVAASISLAPAGAALGGAGGLLAQWGSVATGAAVFAGAAGGSAAGSVSYPQPGGASVQETLTAKGPLAAVLAAGVENISQAQRVTFHLYRKVILPLDGWVFWVRASILSPSAMINGAPINTWGPNQTRGVVNPAAVLIAPGSLHIATVNQQAADESFSENTVTFTSEVPIQDLNEVSPTTMYIARVGDFRFAFSKRENFYKQADLYHYVGSGVWPIMEQMIIENPSDLNARDLVVSNSLPIWLALNKICPMYPSFLVPDNLPPPYGAVDINGRATQAMQAMPYLDDKGSHWQLVSDDVEITFYGLRNPDALSYLDYILGESLATETFGVMDIPTIQDEKRVQVELSTLALKKRIALKVSYQQIAVRAYARQLIESAFATVRVAA